MNMYLNIHIKRTDVCNALVKAHLGDGVAGGKRVSRVCSSESAAQWRDKQLFVPSFKRRPSSLRTREKKM